MLGDVIGLYVPAKLKEPYRRRMARCLAKIDEARGPLPKKG
jgi:hypothetical protein